MASADVATGAPVTAAVAGGADEKPKRGKATKEPKAKKPVAPRKSRSSSSHPPFLVMITDAIVALKERTGSSLPAIAKFIEAKEKQLPGNFRKLLLVQLKRLVASGKLVKVKNSFKLPARFPSASAATGKTAPVKKAMEKKGTATAKPKPKAEGVTGEKRKAKTDKTKGSPAKKAKKSVTAGKPKKAVNTEATKKKATPVKSLRKPKSVKSPVKSVRKPKSVKSPAKRGKK